MAKPVSKHLSRPFHICLQLSIFVKLYAAPPLFETEQTQLQRVRHNTDISTCHVACWAVYHIPWIWPILILTLYAYASQIILWHVNQLLGCSAGVAQRSVARQPSAKQLATEYMQRGSEGRRSLLRAVAMTSRNSVGIRLPRARTIGGQNWSSNPNTVQYLPYRFSYLNLMHISYSNNSSIS
jgi:hypothetical protein